MLPYFFFSGSMPISSERKQIDFELRLYKEIQDAGRTDTNFIKYGFLDSRHLETLGNGKISTFFRREGKGGVRIFSGRKKVIH